MRRRPIIWGLVPAAALIVGVCVAGCGSSSTTTETTAVITQAEFVKQGNAICGAGNKAQQAKTDAYAQKLGLKKNQEPSKAQLTEIANSVLIPNVQAQINAVKALGAPSGEEQQVNAAIESSQKALDKIKANPELGYGKQDLFAAAAKQLHALGLKECAPNS